MIYNFLTLPDRDGAVRVLNLSGIVGRDVRRITDGPEPSGRFWAVNWKNDLPLLAAQEILFMNWGEFFEVHNKVWYRDVLGSSSWIRIKSESELPEIREIIIEDQESSAILYKPLIELYRCNNA